eukprot:SAG11_NODE_17507_length_516_cov_1.059952_1_plen_27_part_10
MCGPTGLAGAIVGGMMMGAMMDGEGKS